VALQVQKELEHRFNEADKLRKQQVERAEYEVNLARRRFMRVDPGNRLVADHRCGSCGMDRKFVQLDKMGASES